MCPSLSFLVCNTLRTTLPARLLATARAGADSRNEAPGRRWRESRRAGAARAPRARPRFLALRSGVASGQRRLLSGLLADGRGQHALRLPGQDPHPGERPPRCRSCGGAGRAGAPRGRRGVSKGPARGQVPERPQRAERGGGAACGGAGPGRREAGPGHRGGVSGR